MLNNYFKFNNRSLLGLNINFLGKKILEWMPYITLIVKTLLMCLFAIGTRGTLPRYRFDQLTQLNWKHFIFIWVGFLTLNTLYFVLFF